MDVKAPPTQLPAAPAPSTLSIPDLAKAINERMSAMLTSVRTSVQRAMEIGELLVEAKERVGHGKFETWLSTNCQLSRASAARYMNLAKQRPKIEEQLSGKSLNLRDLNLSSAQRLLAPPKKPATEAEKKPEPAPTDHYNKIEEDLLRALLDLDLPDAKGCADRTIGALNDTVEDIKGVIEQAQARRMP